MDGTKGIFFCRPFTVESLVKEYINFYKVNFTLCASSCSWWIIITFTRKLY